jgi:4-hydroxy-tetrahydrodipicolinate synthase
MTGRFGAVVTAMVTPFRDDHSLDLDTAQELATYLLEHGSDAVVVAGSTGEAPTLTHQEKADLYGAVVEAARGKGRVICGTGTYSTAETLELTEAAEEAGADGLLVVTPYYNKPPQRGLVAHFQRVADATSLPVIAYNIPGRTATRIEHDTLLQLAAVPNIVAVKDSTGDFQGISRLISEAPPDFEVYSGDDWATFGYVCLGAVGVVSVASHLVGDRIRQMVDLIEGGDHAAARKIHRELEPLFNALFITSNPIPVKAALEMVGRAAGPPRMPLVPATSEERKRIQKALEDAGLL